MTIPKSFLGAIIVVGCFLGGFSGSAQAALQWEFEISGNFDLIGTGTFAFNTASSADPGAAVTEFSFSGQTFGHTWECSGGCGVRGDWEIDVDDWFINSMFLSTDSFGTDTVGIMANLFMTTGHAFSFCDSGHPTGCGGYPIGEASGEVFFFPVHNEIPEPGSLVLFVLGLLGLGVLHRRRQIASI